MKEYSVVLKGSLDPLETRELLVRSFKSIEKIYFELENNSFVDFGETIINSRDIVYVHNVENLSG